MALGRNQDSPVSALIARRWDVEEFVCLPGLMMRFRIKQR